MSRIKLKDSITDIVYKMSDGNPGAVTAIMEMLQPTAQAIDPDSALGPIGKLMQLDTMEIYGVDIYILWNDVCGRDMIKFFTILRAYQLGLINPEVIKEIASDQDRQKLHYINVEELHSLVKKELPDFADLCEQ